MGQELKCRVEFGEQSSEGKALLESTEIVFRGGFRLKIAFQAILSMQAADGKLKIKFPEGLAVFHLGDKAEKWADRIRNPPSRLDKMGVKPYSKIQLIGKFDNDFKHELVIRGAVRVKSKPDIAFLAVKQKDDLVELAYLTESPVWIVYPKGLKNITENDVLAAGRAAGFSDIKVCAFSATHTALKFKPRNR
jgi:hypothetical protein